MITAVRPILPSAKLAAGHLSSTATGRNTVVPICVKASGTTASPAITITGRKKNVIVLHTGKNVFPEEIEALLDQCDAIKECVVYNSQKGGRDCISAKIVYDINLEREDAENQIVEHINKVNRMLIDYKQIKEWDITDVEMEKTTTKKIKRANI